MNGRIPIAAAVLAACLAGCVNGSTYFPFVSGARDPAFGQTIGEQQIVDIGTTDLLVDGAFFTPDDVVIWNGAPQHTTYKAPGELAVSLDPGLTDTNGTALVAVTAADGFTSDATQVTVKVTATAVKSFSPTTAPAGSGPVTLTIEGIGFLPGLTVLWNLTPLATTRVSGSRLTATIPAALLAVPGQSIIQVATQCCDSIQTLTGGSAAFAIGSSKIVEAKTAGAFGNSLFEVGDLAADDARGRIYAAANGGLWSIDTQTATATQVLGNPSNVASIALSDQAQFLYTVTNELHGTPATRYTLPDFSGPVALAALDVSPAPGLPSSAAVVLTTGEIGIMDDTTVRLNKLQAEFNGPFDLPMWGFDATSLYRGTDTGLAHHTVDATGIAPTPAEVIPAINRPVVYDRGLRRFFGTRGTIFDEQGTTHGTFALPLDRFGAPLCPLLVPDAGHRKVFFACAEDIGITLRAFDADTSAATGMVVLVAGGPANDISRVKMVRFGSNGLAVTTGTGLLLYTGDVVR